MKYYRIAGSLDESFKWISVPLAPDGTEVDVWQFSVCKRLPALPPITFSIKAKGRQPDFFITTYAIPLASERCLSALMAVDKTSVEAIPVKLQDGEEMFVLNILPCVDCLDKERSKIDYYPKQFADKNKAGLPRMVVDLTIHKDRVLSSHIFRIKDWPLPVIVSQEIVSQFEKHGVSGYVLVSEV